MAIADDITALESKLHQLKTDYEQYFLGYQKTAPEKLRLDVDRLVRLLTGQTITNTGLKFRLNTITAKFGSYRTYWDRTLREIEEGRYVKDKFKMKLHDAEKQQPAPAPSSAKPSQAASTDENHIKQIYEAYAKARQDTKEPVPKYEAVADLIKKQTPIIMERYNASAVEFKVVIEDGKAKLKAVPKK